MTDLIIIAVLALILGAAALSIRKAKKRGVQCIGCSGSCNGCCGSCQGGCHKS